MTQMKTNQKNWIVLGSVLVVAALGVASAYNTIQRDQPKTGLAAFVHDCGSNKHRPESCNTLDGVEAKFAIKLISEIEAVHVKTRDTAHKIAAGTLTSDAYQACLKTGECASVPMLPTNIDPASPEAMTGENAKISKTFWAFAEKDNLDPLQCDYIPACALGVSRGLLTLNKGKLRAAKTETAQ